MASGDIINDFLAFTISLTNQPEEFNEGSIADPEYRKKLLWSAKALLNNGKGNLKGSPGIYFNRVETPFALILYTRTWPEFKPFRSFNGAPMASTLPSEDRLTLLPNSSPAASP